MKTISVAFVALLSLAAAGCKKGKDAKVDATSCEGVVANMMAMQGDEMLGQLPKDKQPKWKAKVTETLVASCKEDAWPEAVRTCIAAGKDGKAVDACGNQLSKEQKDKVLARIDPVMKAIMEDMGMVMPPPEPPPAAPAAPAAPGTTEAPAAAIPECAAYEATYGAYAACAAVPQADKDAAKQALEAAKQGWAALAAPDATPEAKKTAADACKVADEALKKAAAAAKCAP